MNDQPADNNKAKDTTNRLILLDGIEQIEVPGDDYLNEVVTLSTLRNGIRQLYGMVKKREVAFDRAGGSEYKMFSFGSKNPDERHVLETIACFFHWFGISVCNYARLVGFIRGLSRGTFSRADLTDFNAFKVVKPAIDDYVSEIAELGDVKIWRNKVFAHFAITDPFKADNIATLDMSVMFPVALLNWRYVVGGLQHFRGNSKGSFTSELPQWSLTEVFESLEPRFWPGLRFHVADGPQDSDEHP